MLWPRALEKALERLSARHSEESAAYGKRARQRGATRRLRGGSPSQRTHNRCPNAHCKRQDQQRHRHEVATKEHRWWQEEILGHTQREPASSTGLAREAPRRVARQSREQRDAAGRGALTGAAHQSKCDRCVRRHASPQTKAWRRAQSRARTHTHTRARSADSSAEACSSQAPLN
jgi:hypothetical protein